MAETPNQISTVHQVSHHTAASCSTQTQAIYHSENPQSNQQGDSPSSALIQYDRISFPYGLPVGLQISMKTKVLPCFDAASTPVTSRNLSTTGEHEAITVGQMCLAQEQQITMSWGAPEVNRQTGCTAIAGATPTQHQTPTVMVTFEEPREAPERRSSAALLAAGVVRTGVVARKRRRSERLQDGPSGPSAKENLSSSSSLSTSYPSMAIVSSSEHGSQPMIPDTTPLGSQHMTVPDPVGGLLGDLACLDVTGTPSSSSDTSTNTPQGCHGSVASESECCFSEQLRESSLKERVDPQSLISTSPEALKLGSCAPLQELLELEAKEACDWLRAAGFPQYAQLYEDSCFPISITSVVRDHDFLDRDSIEALRRRLNTLNNCASRKLDKSSPRKRSEDSDEEEQCAISNKWTFERTSRRWSRLEDLDVFSHASLGSEGDPYKGSACPSRESLLTDGSETQDAGSLHSTNGLSGHSHAMPQRQLSVGTLSTDTQLGLPWGSCMAIENGEPRTNGCGRTPSPRKAWKEENDSNSEFCDVWMAVQSVNGTTATPALLAPSPEMDVVLAPRSRSKSLLKSLRGKGITQATSNGGRRRVGGLVISGPICGGPDEETLRRFNCVDLPPSPGLTSPLATSPSSCGGGKRGGVYLGDFDPLQHGAAAAEDNRVLCLPPDHKPGTFPRTLSTESLHAARESDSGWGAWVHLEGHDARSPNRVVDGRNAATSKPFLLKRTSSVGSAASRISIYDNVPLSLLEDSPPNGFCSQLDAILQQVNGLQALLSQWSEQLSAEDLDEWDSARDSTCHSPASPHPQGELDGTDRSPSGRTTPPSDLDSTGTSIVDSEDSGIQERHDSGTAHGLARPNRRQRLRWHSFQTSHRPSLGSASLHIESQSVAQMNLAQRLCLLRLTALMEKYTPSNRHGWNWAVPKFMKRMRAPDYRDKNVFGVPLLLCVQRMGQPLPQGIQQAMRYLRSQCLDQVGLFRKSGVKSRIQALRDMNESSPEGISYEGQSAYDVADMLKQYFRDLPEPLFASKLADTFLQIYQYVPKEQQLQALQAAVLLLPDESREALHTLLCFLSDVAAASAENQMSPKNLAVCLAPSLFHLNTVKRENSNARQRKYSIGKPDQKDLSENLAAIQGLAHMITECKRLFKIPEEVVGQCRVSYLEQDTQPISLADLGHPCDLESQRLTASTSPFPPSPVPTLGMPGARRPSRSSEGGADEYAQGEATEGDNGAHKACPTGLDYSAHLESCVQGLLKEARDRFRGWVNCSSIEPSIDLAYKKVGDGHVLRLWKACSEVDAPPQRLLQRLRNERHLWDPDLLHWQVVETLDNHTELFRYVLDSMAPHPARDYLVLRSWQTDLPRGCCVLVTTSVEHPEVPADTGGEVRGMVLASRFLLEPAGPGRSRLTHICRLDTRGRSSDWYNKAFGHLCAMEIARIRDSFKKTKADLPETKV